MKTVASVWPSPVLRLLGVVGALGVALVFPFGVSAQVVISEIMYDLEEGSDSGREWIEVFNSGSGSVTLTDWRLFEGETNHKISAHTASESVPSGGYAVVADNPTKFLADWPGFSGLLFDSAFSLSNSGESLILRNGDLVDKDSISYTTDMGASGNGDSLHRTSSGANTFQAMLPTPGSGQLTILGGVDTSSNTSEQESTLAQDEEEQSIPYVPPEPEVYAYAGEDRGVIVGADTLFEGLAFSKNGTHIKTDVRFLWNFGDGEITEGNTVSHVWRHPGRYALVLDIGSGEYAASDMVVITARPANLELSISEEGDVVVANKGTRNIDVSFWHLRSSGLHFQIPEHTVVLSGEKIHFSREVTELTLGIDTALLYPNGTEAYTLSPKVEEEKEEIAVAVPLDTRKITPDTVNTVVGLVYEEEAPEEIEKEVFEEVIPAKEIAEDQVASVGASKNWFDIEWQWVVALLSIIVVGAIGAAAARSASREEYTILEED